MMQSTPRKRYNIAFPSASGIELMLLGGINPTSVTTAVIKVGGVRSYNGFNTSNPGSDGGVGVDP